MNDEIHNACCDNTPRWKRKLRHAIHEVRFQIKLFVWHRHLYRPVMKLAHRFNWHHAPPSPLADENGVRHHWCQWCGLRGTTYTNGPTPPGPLAKEGK